MKRPIINPGKVVITNGAAAALSADKTVELLRRHITGDWGDLDAHGPRRQPDGPALRTSCALSVHARRRPENLDRHRALA
jgi:hypothetical protein